MKRKTASIVLMVLLAAMVGSLDAQQLRVSNFYVFNPSLVNPGTVGTGELNQINISHQQRKLAVNGLRSFSDYLNFSSQPLGRKGRFGYGFNVMSDYEWTEFRLGLNGAVSVSLIKTESQRLSLGIMGGLINWGSSYNGVRVYDRTETILAGRGNFVELDAGVGGEYRLNTRVIRLDLSGFAMQMPGSFITRPENNVAGMNVYPHLFIAGGLLVQPIHNIFVGPRVFYRKIFMDTVQTGSGGRLDIGLRLDLERQKTWFGGSFRPGLEGGLLNVAFGLRIKETDTVGDPTKYGYFIDLNSGFSFPMGQTSAFGPTAELGLNIIMGRHNRLALRNDTVRVSSGPFWSDEGNFNDHLGVKMKPNGPQGLRGTTKWNNNFVVLSYTFDDNSYQYVGNTPQIANDTLFSELGPEWIGVDAFVENLIDNVIDEALHPDTNNIVNPEILEPLKDLVSIELSTTLIVDENEANKEAKGMMYEGEMGVNNRRRDSLLIHVVYNDVDTVIGAGKDHAITNLELAALKMHAIRKKLEFELNERYGEDWAVLWDGEEPTEERLGSKNKVVYLKTPRIQPNNPNQPAYQVNTVKLRFTRGANTVVSNEGRETGRNKKGDRRRRNSSNGQRIRDKVY